MRKFKEGRYTIIKIKTMRQLIYIVFIAAFLIGFLISQATAQNRVNQNGLVGGPDNTNFTKEEILKAFDNKGYTLQVDTKAKEIIVINNNNFEVLSIKNEYTYRRIMNFKLEGTGFRNRYEYIVYWLNSVVEILCLNEYC